MTRRWHSLDNTSSSKLQQLWASMARAFARAIADNHAGGNTCRVLQPPTGTGKTQGLCVYAALSIGQNHASSAPLGILVVTRTITQANDIVATIKQLVSDPADADRVRASHSEAKQTPLAMRTADVLVITHEAYTRALEGLHRQFGRWEDYTTWTHGPRRLTIIDEALSGAVEENQIKADDIRFALGFIGPLLRGQFPKQVEALNRACKVLDQIAAFNADRKEESAARIISKGGRDGRIFPGPCAMGPLREAMKNIRYDLIASNKDSPADHRRIADKVDRALKDCEAIMTRWAYYYRKGKDHTFNSSQLLIPPDLPGPVILDATASQNFLWKLLGSRAEIADVPHGTRSYSNVTIHVARGGGGLGKSTMTEKAKVRIPRLLSNLGRHLTPDRKVLLCVHKKIKHTALSYDPGFAAYSVANWGAIDGKNDWNDHDAVVIFGLPYRDPIWATNTFFALQGLQDDRWLEQPSWGAYADVRREMQRRQLTVSIIQAVNRVRCRQVIDVDGNCPPTDVFLVLPNGAEGDALLGHIQEEMPGATVVPWEFEMDGPSERVRRGSSHEPLLALMADRLPGETPMPFIKSELGLTHSGVKDLQGVLRNDDHALTKALTDLGVRYMTTGKGRGARSYLLKQ